MERRRAPSGTRTGRCRAARPGPGNAVNAHGGGVIKVCDTFYLHGEYFLSTTTDNDFNGFSMYSSKDLAPGVQTHVIKRRASIWVPPGDSSTA